MKRALWIVTWVAISAAAGWASWAVGVRRGAALERKAWAAAACRSGHAIVTHDADGLPAFEWLPGCCDHWDLVRARHRLEAAGLVVGEPEDVRGARTAYLGGRLVRLVGQ